MHKDLRDYERPQKILFFVALRANNREIIPFVVAYIMKKREKKGARSVPTPFGMSLRGQVLVQLLRPKSLNRLLNFAS